MQHIPLWARWRTVLLETSMRTDVASATSARGFWPQSTTGGRGNHFVQPPDDAFNGGHLVDAVFRGRRGAPISLVCQQVAPSGRLSECRAQLTIDGAEILCVPITWKAAFGCSVKKETQVWIKQSS